MLEHKFRINKITRIKQRGGGEPGDEATWHVHVWLVKIIYLGILDYTVAFLSHTDTSKNFNQVIILHMKLIRGTKKAQDRETMVQREILARFLIWRIGNFVEI